MRWMLAGLLGLSLAAAAPQVAEARGDARTTVSTPRAGKPAAAPARAASGRTAAAPARATRTQAAAPARGTRPQAGLATRQGRLAEVNSQRARAMTAIPYSRQQAAAPAGLRQSAMASCTTRNGRRSCAPAQARAVSFRWGSDLGPPTMAQSTCPDGTIATMAIGHTNVTRCVPL